MKKTSVISALLIAISLFFGTINAEAKSVNFRANPLGLLFGVANLDVDVGISDSFTLGPSISYVSISLFDTKFTGLWYGVRGNYYFTGPAFSDGWYVGPFFNMVNLSLEETVSGTTYEAETTGTAFGALVGYQWMWDTFNINLGAGYVSYSVPSDVESDTKNGQTVRIETSGFSGGSTTFEFTLGLAF